MKNLTVKVREEVAIGLDDPRCVARFVSFDGFASGEQHFAVLFGAPDQGLEGAGPLVRIHSECITGDVFGSLRCDCGKQLKEAYGLMSQQGGILLYLRQEGRGIGLERFPADLSRRGIHRDALI